MGIRTALLWLLLYPALCLAQSETIEVACDTVVFGYHYKAKQITKDGHIVAFGSHDARGRKTGFWCHLRDEDMFRMEGQYRKNVRVGTWWMNNREFFTYNRRGKIIRKGSGMRGGNALLF